MCIVKGEISSIKNVILMPNYKYQYSHKKIKRGALMKKSVFIILIIFLLNISFISAASYTQTAADVSPGVFSDGDYYFPSTLYVGTDSSSGTVTPAVFIGTDADDYGIYYFGSEYAYPLYIISGHTGGYGVYAKANIGVYGETEDGNGIYGKATGNGIGVKAYSTNKAFYATGADYGLYIADSNTYGVIAYSDSVGGKFIGDSQGVSGTGDYYGGYFSSDTTGVYGLADVTGVWGVSSSSASSECGVKGENSNSDNIGYLGCKNNGIYTPDDADVDGNLDVGSCSGCDIAEHFLGNGLEPGDVVVLDSTASRGVKKTTKPYDKLAAGIVSTDPTIVMGLEDGVPIALSGVVPTKVIGAVHIGDLLTTSSTAGYAMACQDYQKCTGAIIGKAMEENKEGKGKITALVMLG